MTQPFEPSGQPRGTEPREESPYGEALGTLANLGWQVMLTAGVAAIALGVIILVWPGETLRVVGVLFGLYLLISGVFQLAGAFGTHVQTHLRVLHFFSGALFILLGLICFRGRLGSSILLLALWIGFGWLLRGIMMTASAASSRETPARGWQLFLGIITLLGGIVLIVSPFRSIAALTLVTGIWLIVLGVMEVANAIQLRVHAGHRLAPGAATRRPRLHSRPHPQH